MRAIITKKHPDRFWLILTRNECFDVLPNTLSVYKVWGKEGGAEVCLPSRYFKKVADKLEVIKEYVPGMDWSEGGRYEERSKEEALEILALD